jgi:hypothetical protein
MDLVASCEQLTTHEPLLLSGVEEAVLQVLRMAWCKLATLATHGPLLALGTLEELDQAMLSVT